MRGSRQTEGLTEGLTQANSCELLYTLFAKGPGEISISPLRPPGDPRNPFETIAPRRGTALYAVFVLYQKAPPFMGELLSVSEAEGEYLAALDIFEPHPFRHGLRRDTNAGWNMVVLQRCRLQYFLFRTILPSLHRPLGALGSNPPHAGTAFGWW